MNRPAEKAGAGAGGLVAILLAAGLPKAAAVPAAFAAGAVPAAVTWLVNHGGIRGAIRSLWSGSGPGPAG